MLATNVEHANDNSRVFGNALRHGGQKRYQILAFRKSCLRQSLNVYLPSSDKTHCVACKRNA